MKKIKWKKSWRRQGRRADDLAWMNYRDFRKTGKGSRGCVFAYSLLFCIICKHLQANGRLCFARVLTELLCYQ